MQRNEEVKLVTVFAAGVFTAAATVAVSGLGGSVTQPASIKAIPTPAANFPGLPILSIIVSPFEYS
ncbi:MAG: hypothetical protein OEL88_05055 [Sterolibacteriaceae bacterium MAG5]|nr:hypothetical protein [Candidatus Nitricoxidireducens bremensis]